MAVLVRCEHCGAPHRVVTSGERFLCDYCQGWNVLEGQTGSDELICPTTTSKSRIAESVRRHLQLRGLVTVSLKLGSRIQLPLWQLVSREGEEILLPAAMLDDPVISRLEPPALPLVALNDPRARGIQIQGSTLQVSREQAEASALASFQETGSTLESVRLIWLSLVPVHLQSLSGNYEGFYLEGADKVLLGSLPPSAGDEILRPALAISLLGYFILCLVLGVMCRGWGTRITALLVCAGASWFLFRSMLPSWLKERGS